jgi:hypothetical protein
MALGALPRFLSSTHYREWQNESAAMQRSAAPPPPAQPLAFLPRGLRRARVSPACARGARLAELLPSLECLPLMVSLANASRERPGFPLVFVNACFERVTGFARGAVLGRNCRFLQGARDGRGAEPDVVRKIARAVSSATH